MATTKQRNDPDWPVLKAMIRDLAKAKGLMNPDGTPNLRQLGAGAGKAYTILYPIMQQHHRPTAETLEALADFARKEPRVPALADYGLWLRVGGFLVGSEPRAGGRKLDATEQKVLDMLRGMDPQEKQQVYDLFTDIRGMLASRAPLGGAGTGEHALALAR